MNTILIGLRGCGKTTAGRVAASLLNRAFIDLDDRTAAIVGLSASECFARRGEAAWREAESSALREALDRNTASILALGGGTPTAPEAELMLRIAREERGDAIGWLDAPAGILAARIAGDGDRPALTELPPLEEMTEIDRRRRPIFERLADRRIDVGEETIATTAGAVIALATRG
jgi:shikimate kinase